VNDYIPIRLAIAGALGRMGQAVARTADGRDDVRIAARFDREAGGELVSRNDAISVADVVIDFTGAGASSDLVAHCATLASPPALVIGSTGFSPQQEAAIVAAQAAGNLVIVKAGNFSLGVNMLMGLVRQAAAALPARDWDIEVFEAHHRRKIDAPSGTALMLGRAAAQGRDTVLPDEIVADRNGTRVAGDIGFSVMRGGGIIGEHSVVFAGEEELLTLAHSATDRGLFARGALAAALWTHGKAPGLYDMQDVLGFKA
jgi:4-hydroxy-tetrahydrodipicolinate reductase